MCQRRQNSVTDFEIYGKRKFTGIWNPNIFPSPIAIIEYPAKSKYSSMEYATAPSHANGVEILLNPIVCTLFHNIPTRSAIMTLDPSPITRIRMPLSKSRAVTVLLFRQLLTSV